MSTLPYDDPAELACRLARADGDEKLTDAERAFFRQVVETYGEYTVFTAESAAQQFGLETAEVEAMSEKLERHFYFGPYVRKDEWEWPADKRARLYGLRE